MFKNVIVLTFRQLWLILYLQLFLLVAMLRKYYSKKKKKKKKTWAWPSHCCYFKGKEVRTLLLRDWWSDLWTQSQGCEPQRAGCDFIEGLSCRGGGNMSMKVKDVGSSQRRENHRYFYLILNVLIYINTHWNKLLCVCVCFVHMVNTLLLDKNGVHCAGPSAAHASCDQWCDYGDL